MQRSHPRTSVTLLAVVVPALLLSRTHALSQNVVATSSFKLQSDVVPVRSTTLNESDSGEGRPMRHSQGHGDAVPQLQSETVWSVTYPSGDTVVVISVAAGVLRVRFLIFFLPIFIMACVVAPSRFGTYTTHTHTHTHT